MAGIPLGFLDWKPTRNAVVVNTPEKLSGERSAKSESKATGTMPNALALGS